ncbi:hypothetical protein BH23ACT10_BH23ACT10_36050 [soil metagenome]
MLAFVIGTAVAVVAAVSVIEMVAALTGNASVVVSRQRVASTLEQVRWDDLVLIGVAIAVIVVGLALLLLEVIPPRPEQLALHGPTAAAASVDRRGLQERLRLATLRDDDVARATVAIRRRAKVRAFVVSDVDRRACRKRIHAAVTDAVADIGLARSLRVRVDVSRARERVR